MSRVFELQKRSGHMERENREERQNVIKFDTEAMIDILKRHTLPEKAVSIEKLTEEMSEVFGADFSERTVRRRMEQFLAVQDNTDKGNPEAAKMFYRMFGGRVEYTTAPGIQQGKRSKGTTETQRYYYFEPCLDEASMDMLNGLIISNPFLAAQEKNYLLERLQMLNVPASAGLMQEDEKAVRTKREQALPGEKEKVLKTVGVLHYAIQMGYRVCVKYGIYDTVTLGICHKFASVSDKTSCRYTELKSCISSCSRTHGKKLALSG